MKTQMQVGTPLLSETVLVSMSPRQKAIVAKIDETDFSNIRAKAKEELLSTGFFADDAYLDAAILALKQYYMICFLDDNPHAISKELDPFWHAHIICTVEYLGFCENLGIRYMHHKPLINRTTTALNAVRKMYEHTITVMNTCFDSVSATFYPPKVADEQLVCTHYTADEDGTSVGFLQSGDIYLPQVAGLHELQYYQN